jgi:predicted  nucleic acid-binding Zn-ribbon protein
VLWQSIAQRAKSLVDLQKNAMEREQRISDLEQVLKQIREAAAAEKKRLEDELAKVKRKDIEATAQFNTVSIGRSNLRVDDLVEQQEVFLWYANCDIL